MEQKGTIYPLTLLLIATLGIIAFLVVTTFLPFKNSLFSSVYPKQTSQAASSQDQAATDPLAPTVAITSPTNGAVVTPTGEISISLVPTNNIEISKIEVSINDDLFCIMDSPPYECSWRVPSFKETTYIIGAKAYGKDNHLFTSEIMVQSK